MVHYGPGRQIQTTPSPDCGNCGSEHTEVLGRLEDGKTFIIRCTGCGAHSTVLLQVAVEPNLASSHEHFLYWSR